jgi:hypothetical protein
MARRGRNEDDPRIPLFFVSYSQVRPNPQAATDPADYKELALDLFNDLSVHVSELAGRPTGADSGFIDRSLGGGERWTPALLKAAGSCQVFIPLVSPLFTFSEWCGMEWDAFSRRRAVAREAPRTDQATAILPVIWVPTAVKNLPRVVSEIQMFSPGGLERSDITRYAREGLYGLRAMGGHSTYNAVVWRLAQRVMEIHQTHWVEPWIPKGTDELRNVFKEDG